MSYTVAARDPSVSFDRTEKAVRAVLSSAPGARLRDLDRTNQIAVLEIPGHLVETVRTRLGDDFFLDPNESLNY